MIFHFSRAELNRMSTIRFVLQIFDWTASIWLCVHYRFTFLSPFSTWSLARWDGKENWTRDWRNKAVFRTKETSARKSCFQCSRAWKINQRTCYTSWEYAQETWQKYKGFESWFTVRFKANEGRSPSI